MKKSNKLFIGLIAAMVLMPLIYGVIDSKYKRVDAGMYYSQVEKESADLDEKDVYMETVTLPNFDKVKVIGDGSFLNIRIVKCDKHALKISKKGINSLRDPKIEDGTLILESNRDNSGIRHTSHISLFIPHLNGFALENAGIMNLITDIDSLNLICTGVFALGFSERTNIRNLNLSIRKSDLTFNFNPLPQNLINLDLDLYESKIKLYTDRDLDQLDVKLKDASIFLKGDENVEDGIKVDKLLLTSRDKSKMEFENIKLNKVSGSISPETQTNLPQPALSQIFNSND